MLAEVGTRPTKDSGPPPLIFGGTPNPPASRIQLILGPEHKALILHPRGSSRKFIPSTIGAYFIIISRAPPACSMHPAGQPAPGNTLWNVCCIPPPTKTGMLTQKAPEIASLRRCSIHQSLAQPVRAYTAQHIENDSHRPKSINSLALTRWISHHLTTYTSNQRSNSTKHKVIGNKSKHSKP